jgi:hypothetical protein
MIETRSILDGDPLADIADQLVPALDDLDDVDDDPLEALDWEGPDWFDPADFELSLLDPTAQSPACPESAVLDPAVPDPAVPDSAVPDSAVPDSAVPDSATHDSAVLGLAAPESAVLEVPLADLGPDRLLDELQVVHRRIAASQARQALLITELAHCRAQNAVTELTGRKARGMEALSIGARAVGEEVALELSLSKTAGQSLTDTCVGLCLEAPETLEALAAGEIDWAKAAEILVLVQKLRLTQADTNSDLPQEERVDPEELGRELEKRLLGRASGQTLAALKRRGRKDMIEANPRAAENRAKRERTRRFFAFLPDDDSMARLSAYLPADAGMRAKNALTRLAYHARNQSECGDRRTLDQLRVDALVDTLVQAADDLHSGDEEVRAGADGARSAAPCSPKTTTQESNSNSAGSSRPAPRASEPNVPSTAPASTESASTESASTESASTESASTEPGEAVPTEPVDHPAVPFAAPTGDGYYPDTDLDDLAPNDDETVCDDEAPNDDEAVHDDETPNDNEPVCDEGSVCGDLSADECLGIHEGHSANDDRAGQDDLTSKDGVRAPCSGAESNRRTGPRSSSDVSSSDVATRPGSNLTRSTASRYSNSDPRVQITIGAGTLIGLDDDPGWLHGYGPIVASMARDIAATGTWRCAITDPAHGTLMGLGTGTYTRGYRPTQALRRHLQARDRVCRVPGCNVAAEMCDVDHRVPWRRGGPTCECCTECLCKTHHRMKHECGFTLTLSANPNDPPGTLVWTTPSGREYPSYPAQLGRPDGKRNPADPRPDPDDGQSRTHGLRDDSQDEGPPTEATECPEAAECQACSEADRVNAAEEELWAVINQPSRNSSASSGPSSEASGSDASTPDTPGECPGAETATDDSAGPWHSRLRMRSPLLLSPLPQDGDPPPF